MRSLTATADGRHVCLYTAGVGCLSLCVDRGAAPEHGKADAWEEAMPGVAPRARTHRRMCRNSAVLTLFPACICWCAAVFVACAVASWCLGHTAAPGARIVCMWK